ncbi:MAG: malate dehydrogenase [Sulfurovum sp.]
MKIEKLTNIEFQKNNETFVLTSFNTNKMTLEARVYEKDKFVRNQTIAFAHIPKKLKAKLNPTK